MTKLSRGLLGKEVAKALQRANIPHVRAVVGGGDMKFRIFEVENRMNTCRFDRCEICHAR